MSRLINDEEFSRVIKKVMNEEMFKAAEPIIKQAMLEIEREMRSRLAAMLVTLVDSSYSLERDGRVVHIRVDLGEKP